MSKHLAIAEAVLNTAQATLKIASQFPNTGKHRNVFIKNYNRRPRNKQKRAVICAQMGLSAFMGAMQIATIQSQPIPKFKPGGNI